MTETFTPDNLYAGHVQPVVVGKETITGAALSRGSVLGKITLGDVTVTADVGNATDGTVTDVSVANDSVKAGDYELIVAADGTLAGSLGTFYMVDPDGQTVMAPLTVGPTPQTLKVAGFEFTLTEGSVKFTAGDKWVLAVAAGSGLCQLVDSSALDGSQVLHAILAEDVDASLSDVAAPVYYTGEFNESALTFGGTDVANTHRARARELGIFFKTNVSA